VRYFKITDSGRSANPTRNPKFDSRKMYFTNRVVNYTWILYQVMFWQLIRETVLKADLINNV